MAEHIKGRHKGLKRAQYIERMKIGTPFCQICSIPFDEKILCCLDHDHVTGEWRGLLCSNCNMGLGFFKDNIDMLQRAINYLETYTPAY